MRKWKSQRGFTIIELLIYLGILSILLIIFVRIFSSLIDVQLESDATTSVQSDGLYMLNRLTYDVHRATAITVPALGSQSATLRLTIGGTAHDYSVDANDNLILTSASSSAQLNSFATYVESISFRQIGNTSSGKNTVQISYTIRSRTRQNVGEEEKTFTTTVGMR